MKHKLKAKLFKAYEQEMNFKPNLESVKKRMNFEKKRHQFIKRAWIPAICSFACACIICIASITILNVQNGKDKSTGDGSSFSIIVSTINRNPSMKEYQIFIHQQYSIHFTFDSLNDVLQVDCPSPLSLEHLTLKDENKELVYQEDKNGYPLEKKEKHTILWKYVDEIGKEEGSFVF